MGTSGEGIHPFFLLLYYEPGLCFILIPPAGCGGGRVCPPSVAIQVEYSTDPVDAECKYRNLVSH